MYYMRIRLEKKMIITFVSLLRSIEDNIFFDRTEKPDDNIFELFIIPEAQTKANEIMNCFQKNGIIIDWNYFPIEHSSLYTYQ